MIVNLFTVMCVNVIKSDYYLESLRMRVIPDMCADGRGTV